jgi:hypothetical protein
MKEPTLSLLPALLLGSILIYFCSCNETADQKKYKKLKNEVLEHYQSDPNPLKEKAHYMKN